MPENLINYRTKKRYYFTQQTEKICPKSENEMNKPRNNGHLSSSKICAVFFLSTRGSDVVCNYWQKENEGRVETTPLMSTDHPYSSKLNSMFSALMVRYTVRKQMENNMTPGRNNDPEWLYVYVGL